MLKELFTPRFPYRVGLRLRQIKFIRSALDDRADLGPGKKKLLLRMGTGLVIIAASNLVCWPLIGLISVLSVRTRHPLIFIVGSPVVWGVMFLVCTFGMFLVGKKGAQAFFRWRARLWVEWLLAHGELIHSTRSTRSQRTPQGPGQASEMRSSSLQH